MRGKKHQRGKENDRGTGKATKRATRNEQVNTPTGANHIALPLNENHAQAIDYLPTVQGNPQAHLDQVTGTVNGDYGAPVLPTFGNDQAPPVYNPNDHEAVIANPLATAAIEHNEGEVAVGPVGQGYETFDVQHHDIQQHLPNGDVANVELATMPTPLDTADYMFLEQMNNLEVPQGWREVFDIARDLIMLLRCPENEWKATKLFQSFVDAVASVDTITSDYLKSRLFHEGRSRDWDRKNRMEFIKMRAFRHLIGRSQNGVTMIVPMPFPALSQKARGDLEVILEMAFNRASEPLKIQAATKFHKNVELSIRDAVAEVLKMFEERTFLNLTSGTPNIVNDTVDQVKNVLDNPLHFGAVVSAMAPTPMNNDTFQSEFSVLTAPLDEKNEFINSELNRIGFYSAETFVFMLLLLTVAHSRTRNPMAGCARELGMRILHDELPKSIAMHMQNNEILANVMLAFPYANFVFALYFRSSLRAQIGRVSEKSDMFWKTIPGLATSMQARNPKSVFMRLRNSTKLVTISTQEYRQRWLNSFRLSAGSRTAAPGGVTVGPVAVDPENDRADLLD